MLPLFSLKKRGNIEVLRRALLQKSLSFGKERQHRGLLYVASLFLYVASLFFGKERQHRGLM